MNHPALEPPRQGTEPEDSCVQFSRELRKEIAPLDMSALVGDNRAELKRVPTAPFDRQQNRPPQRRRCPDVFGLPDVTRRGPQLVDAARPAPEQERERQPDQ